MSKSIDLIERAVAYKKEGHTYEGTGKVFGVLGSTAYRWEKQYDETGDLSNKPLNRGFKKIDPEKVEDIPEEKIAYVDETGIDSCLYREYGYDLIFLPPYSPELDPIEKFWAVFKKELKIFCA